MRSAGLHTRLARASIGYAGLILGVVVVCSPHSMPEPAFGHAVVETCSARHSEHFFFAPGSITHESVTENRLRTDLAYLLSAISGGQSPDAFRLVWLRLSGVPLPAEMERGHALATRAAQPLAQVTGSIELSTDDQQVTTSTKVRQIKAIPNAPLAERLVPGDELVLVEPAGMRTALHSAVSPSLASDLDEHSESDVIVLAEATGSESFLSDNDSWVRTKVTFRPIRIIKDAKRPVTQRPSSVTLYHDGGEVRIDGVRVRAGYFYLYEAGERYLLFLRSLGGDNNAPGKMQYRIDSDGRLAPMPMSNGRFVSTPSAFFGLSVDTVIQGLAQRAAVK